MEIGDKVKFVIETSKIPSDISVGSVGILTDISDDLSLNYGVTFHDKHSYTFDWFNFDELELVTKGEDL